MPYVPIILFLLFFFPPRFLFLGGHSPAHNSIFYKPLETPRLHLNEWLLRTYIPAGSVPFSSMVQIFCVHYFYLALYFFFGQFPGRWLFTGAVGSVGLFLCSMLLWQSQQEENRWSHEQSTRGSYTIVNTNPSFLPESDQAATLEKKATEKTPLVS